MEAVPNLIAQYGKNIGDVRLQDKVVGITFIENIRPVLLGLKQMCDTGRSSEIRLNFVKEPDNQYDPKAVRVEVSISGHPKRLKVGYVPKEHNSLLSYVLQHTDTYSVCVEDLGVFGGTTGKENLGIFYTYRVIDTSNTEMPDSLGY